MVSTWVYDTGFDMGLGDYLPVMVMARTGTMGIHMGGYGHSVLSVVTVSSDKCT